MTAGIIGFLLGAFAMFLLACVFNRTLWEIADKAAVLLYYGPGCRGCVGEVLKTDADLLAWARIYDELREALDDVGLGPVELREVA